MNARAMKSKKLLLAGWIAASVIFLVETIGGLTFGAALLWFCGFMVARSIADIVQPNDGGNPRERSAAK